MKASRAARAERDQIHSESYSAPNEQELVDARDAPSASPSKTMETKMAIAATKNLPESSR